MINLAAPLITTTLSSLGLSALTEKYAPHFSDYVAVGAPVVLNCVACALGALTPAVALIATAAQIILCLTLQHWLREPGNGDTPAATPPVGTPDPASAAITPVGTPDPSREPSPTLNLIENSALANLPANPVATPVLTHYTSQKQGGRNSKSGFEKSDKGQQDRTVVTKKGEVTLVSIMDGHGDGLATVNFLERYLNQNCLENLDRFQSDRDSLIQGYRQTDIAFWEKAKSAIEIQREYSALPSIQGKNSWQVMQSRICHQEIRNFAQTHGLRMEGTSNILSQIQENEYLTTGSTATTALIRQCPDGKTFVTVANVGDSPAIIINTDNSIQRLYTEHSVYNQNELERLKSLGLFDEDDIKRLKNAKIEELRESGHFANLNEEETQKEIERLKKQENFIPEKLSINKETGRLGEYEATRSFGEFVASQEDYKTIELFANASAAPIIAEPSVIETIELDQKAAYIVLMTDGIHKALQEMHSVKQESNLLEDAFKSLAVRIKKAEQESRLNQLANDIFEDYKTAWEAAEEGSEGKTILRKLDDMTITVIPVAHLSQSLEYNLTLEAR